MAVTLPSTPFKIQGRIDYISYASDLISPAGGFTQRINRMGDRFSLSFDLPTLKKNCGVKWDTYISQAIRQGATIELPENVQTEGVKVFSGGQWTYGNILVNGGGQTGMAMNVDNASTSIRLVAGQYFNVTVNGVIYLHRLTADATPNGSGQIVLNFEPMLRASPANNSSINFDTPKISGLISKETTGVSHNTWGYGTVPQIVITENR